MTEIDEKKLATVLTSLVAAVEELRDGVTWPANERAGYKLGQAKETLHEMDLYDFKAE